MMAAPAYSAPAGFSGSYDPSDVAFLLKPVSVAPIDIAVKERLIQSGRRHYSEMLSRETLPDSGYLALYDQALARNGARLAADIASLAETLAARAAGRPEIVLASFARAGTPIGVLLVRALRRLGLQATHYAISIVRGRGIDRQALRHIAAFHDPADVVFVDGWTGKGAIAEELVSSLAARPFGFAPYLAVVADPAGRAELAASGDDYLIASGLLNAIVSGLVSRSVLDPTLIGPEEFHGCVLYPEFERHDRSRAFVDTVDELARRATARQIPDDPGGRAERAAACDALVAGLMAEHSTSERNRIKPGIAEATRAVLRRIPDRLFVRDPDDPDVSHLLHLAAAKGLRVETLPAGAHYRAVALIRSLGSE